MPGLHSYDVDETNILGEGIQGEQFQTPFDTGIKARFERGQQFASEIFGKVDEANEFSYDRYDPDTLEKLDNPWLTPEEAKERYGVSVNGDQRITALSAQYISEQAKIDRDRNEIIERTSKDFLTQSAGFGAELMGNILDPLNVGLAFVPIVSQARSLLWMERFGPIAGRALTGLVEGAVGNAVLEPFTYNAAKTLNYEYSAYDSFLNVAAGGIVGAGLHVGVGAVGDHFGLSEWSRRVETGSIEPDQHHDMTRTAVGQALQDEPVNVAPMYREHILQKLNDNPELKQRVEQYFRNISEGLDEETSRGAFAHTLDSGKSDPVIVSRLMDNSSITSPTLHRGMILANSDDIMERIVAAIENDDRPRSTSRKEQVGKRFAISKLVDAQDMVKEVTGKYPDIKEFAPVKIEIQNTKGKRGFDVAPLSKVKNEEETIIPGDSNLKVLSVEPYTIPDKDLPRQFKGQKVTGYKVTATLDDPIKSLADDLMNTDATPQQILDELKSYQQAENKWFHAPDVVREVDQNIKDSPTEWTDVEAKESLDSIMKQFKPEELEALDVYDEKISMAQKMGKAIQAAAQCVLKEIT